MPSPKITPLRAAVPFFVVSALELAARWFDLDVVPTFTKPLLMPALALVVALAAPDEPKQPRRLLLAGLGFSWAGDVILMGDGMAFFGAGLGAFLLAHCAYVALFVRGLEGRVSPFSLAYAAVYGAMIFFLAPHLGVLFVPVLVYGAVLSAMAALATRGGAALALGGALFLVSDGILAAGRFLPDAPIPRVSFLVMLTYLGAQALITLSVTGILREDRDLPLT